MTNNGIKTFHEDVNTAEDKFDKKDKILCINNFIKKIDIHQIKKLINYEKEHDSDYLDQSNLFNRREK